MTIYVNQKEAERRFTQLFEQKDPFDRLLIAQSQVNNLPIITADRKFALYNIDVIW